MSLAVLSARVRHAPPGLAADQADRIWQELQADLTRRSPAGWHVVVIRSGHMILLDRPDALVAAINSMVESVRGTSTPAIPFEGPS